MYTFCGSDCLKYLCWSNMAFEGLPNNWPELSVPVVCIWLPSKGRIPILDFQLRIKEHQLSFPKLIRLPDSFIRTNPTMSKILELFFLHCEKYKHYLRDQAQCKGSKKRLFKNQTRDINDRRTSTIFRLSLLVKLYSVCLLTMFNYWVQNHTVIPARVVLAIDVSRFCYFHVGCHS